MQTKPPPAIMYPGRAMKKLEGVGRLREKEAYLIWMQSEEAHREPSSIKQH